jgi:hypothetical protein
LDQPITTKNVIISLTTKRCYEFQITMSAEIVELESSIKDIYKLENKESGVRVLVMRFRVVDQDDFFNQELKGTKCKTNSSQLFRDVYYAVNDVCAPGKYKLPYRENLKIRKVQFIEKHYSLAFQGGGAKGLAYVGAYKALQ